MTVPVKDLLRLAPQGFERRDLLSRPLCGVSTDSRTVQPGELFVALRGPAFDGHRFLPEAASRGAGAALVESGADRNGWPEITLVTVQDTTRALGMLARYHRDRYAIPVLAVGGSSGKTTTKEMIAAVLGKRYRVLRTERNYNNQIGVPKTLFRIQRRHEIAVVEIGTNHPGEMKILCDILNPTHGLLTNIGAEHLEFFGSLSGVSREEGSLFTYLATRERGVALVNADDPRVVSRSRGVGQRVLYGFAARGATVKGKRLSLRADATVSFEIVGGRIKKPLALSLRVPGRHNAMNALAAAAVGITFGVSGRAIVEALGGFQAADRRTELEVVGGVKIINDTYNANGDSTIAALETLAAMQTKGKKIAVLGDMLELGVREASEHRRVGKVVSRLGIEYLLTYGERSRRIGESAGKTETIHFEQKNVLAEYLAELAAPGDLVLLKGSRGMGMDDIVVFLRHRLRDGAGNPA